jgi:hypothetical protein
MSDKNAGSAGMPPKKNLDEDGITNPKDGRGPLRKSDDSSTKLPVNTGAPTQPAANRP